MTNEQLKVETDKWVAVEEKRLGRPLTDWEKHVISDQVYFRSLPPGAIGPSGPSA